MNTDRTVEERTEEVDWWAAALASEDPEYLANFWFPRAEGTVTFGSKWFDAALNPLDGASSDVALEVRLVRDPEEAVCRARFEIRTKLALYVDGPSAANVQKLVDTIAAAQRELAERAGVSFAAPGAAKPHVLTAGPRGLLRAYGKGNVFAVQEAAQPLLRAYSFLVSVWRAALIDTGSTTIPRVRAVAEHAIAAENLDMRCLFAAPGDGAEADGRPELTDDLLIRVGLAVGCSLAPNERYARPAEQIVIADRVPHGVVRMVAEYLAATNGVAVDSVLRKVLIPMLRGEFNGPIIECTDGEAAAVRAETKRRQVTTPSGTEN
jgi:hypothetical protein